jgi:hypothetical protein
MRRTNYVQNIKTTTAIIIIIKNQKKKKKKKKKEREREREKRKRESGDRLFGHLLYPYPSPSSSGRAT